MTRRVRLWIATLVTAAFVGGLASGGLALHGSADHPTAAQSNVVTSVASAAGMSPVVVRGSREVSERRNGEHESG